ncbi:MAG: FecR family protein [Eubacterium sp.]|nr:FecR family protein [Eubacterium sp.]
MKKKLIIIISAVIILAAAIVTVFLLKGKKKESYRVLKVYEVDGDATVVRKDLGEIAPYNNMVLESGDTVSLRTGSMILKADEDKYIYLEEDTELVLKATGNSRKNQTTIELKKGAITNDIQEKLFKDSGYEVNTPNSTMSVRGTMFRVYVYEVDGVRYTKVSVFEGSVASYLIYKDGTKSEEEVTIERGKEVIIYEDENITDYLTAPKDIDYSDLPEEVIKLLDNALDEGKDLLITKEEIEKYLSKIVTVTFMYNGKVFGTQTIDKGTKAAVPALAPASSGSWDFDFDKPINKDTVIEWK